MIGSSRFFFASSMVVASSCLSFEESRTAASESRSNSRPARSAGDWAANGTASPNARTAARTTDSDDMGVSFIIHASRGALEREAEAGVELRLLRCAAERLGDAHAHPQRRIVEERHVAYELHAHGGKVREPDLSTGLPCFTRIPEQGQRQLVGAEREVPERLTDECQRDAVLERRGQGPRPAQRARPIPPHGEVPLGPHRLTVAEAQSAGRHSADPKRFRERTGERADADASGEHMMREAADPWNVEVADEL